MLPTAARHLLNSVAATAVGVAETTAINSSLTETLPLITTTMTATTTLTPPALYSNHRRLIIGGIVLAIGVLGNFLALVILARKKTAKNSKYTLMLRCLATNNLIGLLGMLTTLLLKVYLPETVRAHIPWDCAGMVVWRFFGLSSGCIAAVMALERWMALAKPFIYHKHVTYELVRKAINALIFIAMVITFLPLFGFGAYIDLSDPENPKCLRYRDADGFWNKAYSVLFLVFGTLLCVVIVACNLFVTRVLCFIGRTRTTKRHMHYDLVNRERGGNGPRIIEAESSSGTSLYQQPHTTSVTLTAAASPDEIKFAKLMAFLSISFVICWMPQMIAIPMAILPNRVDKTHPFFIIADVLMALHFTSDPYVYVLSRTKHSFLLGCIKRWSCGLRRTQSDQSRLRTTIEQHTTDCGLN